MIKPRLGFYDLSMLIISMVIGIGIFRTPQIVAQKSGTVELYFAAWIIGAVISICGALTFAEIGARYPVAGGFYKVFSFCYHPAFAFMLNWSLVIINASSAASVALIGAEYLSPLIFSSPVSPMNIKYLVVGIVLLLYAINMLGIRSGAGVQNLLSGIKIALILFFCSAIFFAIKLDSVTVQTTANCTLPTANLFFAFGAGLISVFFTYGGYQNTINFGEDVKEPQRNIPRSIFLAMSIILVLYLGINFSYVYVLGFENIKSSPLVAASLANQLLGNTGAAFTSIAIFISVLGFLNAALMYNPRIWYAMSNDNVLPKVFKSMNEKRQTQEFSLTVFTALILIMFFWLETFEQLLNYVMFTDTISLASAALCVFILRSKQKEIAYSGFCVKQNIIPIIFIATLCFITLNVIVNDPLRSLYGAIVFAFGFPLYKLFKKLLNQSL